MMIAAARTMVLVVLCLAGAVSAAGAQDGPPVRPGRTLPAGARIASFDMSTLATASSYARNALARVDEEARARGTALARRAEALEAERLKLERDAALMDEAARTEARQAFEKARIDFTRSREDAQAAVESLRLDVERELRARLFPVVDAVAREKGLYLVIDAASADFLWIHPDIDISEDVAARLDAGQKAP